MSQQQTPSATGSDQTTGTVQVVLVDNDILALKMLREIMSAWPRVAITWTEHNGSDAFDHYRQCESGIRDLPDLFITLDARPVGRRYEPSHPLHQRHDADTRHHFIRADPVLP